MSNDPKALGTLRGLMKIERELPARRAKAARELLDAGWTLARVGEACGVSRQAVWNWLARQPEDNPVPAGALIADLRTPVSPAEPEPATVREEDQMPAVFYA